jgi:hypothetical protein
METAHSSEKIVVSLSCFNAPGDEIKLHSAILVGNGTLVGSVVPVVPQFDMVLQATVCSIVVDACSLSRRQL